jgi:hypothetical protein
LGVWGAGVMVCRNEIERFMICLFSLVFLLFVVEDQKTMITFGMHTSARSLPHSYRIVRVMLLWRCDMTPETQILCISG